MRIRSCRQRNSLRHSPAAIAATFVATALQEEPQASPSDQGAVAAMVLALVGVLAVVFRARKTPDVQRILDKASNENWPDDRTVNELREELRRSAQRQHSSSRRSALDNVCTSPCVSDRERSRRRVDPSGLVEVKKRNCLQQPQLAADYRNSLCPNTIRPGNERPLPREFSAWGRSGGMLRRIEQDDGGR